ncbi:MAG: hypothetical protein Q7S92_01945 [Candidatus Diapherotrites archaeon]|nr:hypothetical protein [Candidatus Diapherotrites archaeon]
MKFKCLIILLILSLGCLQPLDNPQTLPENSIQNFKIQICLINWKENSLNKTTQELIQIAEKIQKFYKEISYEKVNLQFEYKNAQSNSTGTTVNEMLELAYSSCNPSRDTHALIFYPTQINSSNEQELGFIESTFTHRNKISNTDIIQVPEGKLNYLTLAHELGHGLFNFEHPVTLHCGAKVFSETNCETADYGNPFDFMSSGTGHVNAWDKYKAGWSEIKTVTENGNYVISALETKEEKIKGLRVPNSKHPLCLEYRKPIGLDQEIIDNDKQPLPETGCLLVSLCYTENQEYNPGHQNLLLYTDQNPEAKQENHCIKENEKFTDTDLGVSIEFDSLENNQAQVTVEFEN